MVTKALEEIFNENEIKEFILKISSLSSYFERCALTDIESFYLIYNSYLDLWIGKSKALYTSKNAKSGRKIGRISLADESVIRSLFSQGTLGKFLLDINNTCQTKREGFITEFECFAILIDYFYDLWNEKVDLIKIPDSKFDENTMDVLTLKLRMKYFDLLTSKGYGDDLKKEVVYFLRTILERIDSTVDISKGEKEQMHSKALDSIIGEMERNSQLKIALTLKISYLKNLLKGMTLADVKDKVILSNAGIAIQILRALPDLRQALVNH